MTDDPISDTASPPPAPRPRRPGVRPEIDTSNVSAIAEVPLNQFPFLAVLQLDGAKTIAELATLTGISESAATRTIMKMIEAGLIQPDRVAPDEPIRTVSLTLAGATHVARARQGV